MGIARSKSSSNDASYRGFDAVDAPIRKYDEDPYVQKLRKTGNDHRAKYRKFSEKAKKAYEKGRGDQAHGFSQKAKDYKALMEEANEEAKNRLIENQKHDIERGRLDLHGFYVEEAIECLEDFLSKHDSDSYQYTGKWLTVITGKGLHSVGGIAKIRPAVMNYLQSNHYRFNKFDGYLTVERTTDFVDSFQVGTHRKDECCIIL